MENTHLLKDKYYLAGVGMLLLSTVLYLIPEFVEMRTDSFGGLFVMNYGLTLGYWLTLFLNRKSLDQEKKLTYRFVLLTLFLVSAYSLNRSLAVFERSVPWFSAAVIISAVNMLAFPFTERAPRLVKYAMFTLTGATMTVFTYMAFYLFPLYPFGLLGAVLVGFPLHVFAPALYVFNIIKLISKPEHAAYRKFSYIGAAIIAIGATAYAIQWANITRKVNKQAMIALRDPSLPEWINVAKRLDNKPMLQKILKGDLVYSTMNLELGLFDLGRIDRFGEAKKHDPLVHFAMFFSPKLRLSEDERIKFLGSIYQEGHKTEERLWSGDDLITENVETKVRVWPACHLSYTEKLITVSNMQSERRRSEQQEAIYTFYLPEGGVVTSLSLWVNGVEEKAILTTKEKAETAYRTIVGVEVRDPSIVQWREGNRVSVRVFPVLSNSSRMFRIGFTAPLAKVNDELLYQNIQFDGPDKTQASEITDVEFSEPIERKFSSSFISKSESSYKKSGKYEPKWSMRFKAVKPSPCTFSFNGNTYSIKPYHKKLAPVSIRSIYLDLNSSWTRSQYEALINLATKTNRQVFVYDSKMVQVTDENKDELFTKLHHSMFSLFPFHHVKEPAHALVVTSSTMTSCSLEDLTGSRFMDELKMFLSKGEKLHLFNIGGTLSPYLRTLKEYRTFNYDHGEIEVLSALLNDSFYVAEIENENSVVVHSSQIIIDKTPGDAASSGPDHVMRLFAYNQVMFKLGKGIMLQRDISDDIVTIAREAYVVTPVSSLVVLETQRDYDRFDIRDEGASLKNASAGSSGAAPEPHEWALIIIGASLLLYMRFGRRQTLRFR